jgi:hypothetical protein
LSKINDQKFAIRTISVYIPSHGRYDLLSLLYARCSRGIGSLGLSPEYLTTASQMPAQQPKADAGISFSPSNFTQPLNEGWQ